jgi:RND family efflux transporter MFP subunit
MKLLLPRLCKQLFQQKYSLFLISSFVCMFSASAQQINSEGYQLSHISPEPYIQEIKRSGKVGFKRMVNLSFKTAGFLTKLNVDEGDIFKQKQLLAALDTEELIAEKNATYSRLLQAKRNVNRIEALLKKELSSQRELDDALTDVDTTRASYRVAFYNLEKAQIFAPFDGVVVNRNTDLGELQSPSNMALQVASIDNNLVVNVALTGEEISLVHVNQKVKIHLAHFGLIDGTISKIPAMANSQSHLFNIEVLLPATSFTRPLIVGQLAQILIYAQSQDLVYRLPIEALNAMDKNGHALIAVEENNKPIQQSHKIYKIDNQYLYLQAYENSPSLAVITHGWNKLSLKTTEQ